MNYNVIIHPSGFVTGSLLGLSNHPNSEKIARAPRGSKGLTSKGKLTILDACAILSRNFRGQLSFLTWTFPPEYCDQVKANWSRLVRLLLKKLQYWLAKFRLPQNYVGVTELQKNGNPHLHLVFVGRRLRSSNWLIQPSVLDKLLIEAVAEVCPEAEVEPSRFAAAGRVEPVRGDAGRYLGKYLSKPKQAESEHSDSASWFPSSWWFCDRNLRNAVANSLIMFRLKISCWAELHDLFTTAGGFFNLIVREDIAVGWLAFVPPNLVVWLTVKLCGGR
jgi:hypothetical protein